MEGQTDLYPRENSLGISRLVEVEMKDPGFEQWQEVGFSKLTSTHRKIPREFSRGWRVTWGILVWAGLDCFFVAGLDFC